ncbi:sensor histidine kinase [Nonomuraea aridisoli]|uniref:Two-component sensor histidine kinase n=1 Tax=Nonomuraea aridisoli TaxID=2070368 RepID=A0A2W2EM40_9ACTN|nr:histidine kinase [Nonomuraea aridisoli]PZG23473.1 two-component sensor histidine kinase [Nonomuraea aridisoli]
MRTPVVNTRVIAGVAVALFVGSMTAALTLPVLQLSVWARPPWSWVVVIPFGLLLAGCYARVLWAAFLRRHTWRHRIDAAVVVLIGYGMPLFAGPVWTALPMVVVSVAPIVFARPAAAWAATGVSVAVTPPLLLMIGTPPPMALILGLVMMPFMAPMTYGVAWLCHLVDDLRETRAELARRVVDQERLRFARDLHDTLGHTLHAIALRAELGERLAAGDPAGAGAGAELAEIQRIARSAVHDVREVVRGYRATSLATELDGAAAVLTAAGIRCERPEPPGGLPAHVHGPLGWVAREAVTNVLRHSAATWCEVTVHTEEGNVILEIVNDGAPSGARVVAGSGLRGLAERVSAAGGTLDIAAAGGLFRLTAFLPLSLAAGDGRREEVPA